MGWDVGAPAAGTTHHAGLDDVTADQHHAKAHGADHATGQPDALTAGAIGAATTGHGHTHAATTGQTANDHHNQSHAIGGADHSGTLAHTALSSVGADDHHAKSHAHSGADGSGTVAHSATTGITATDHHTNANDPSAGEKAGLAGTSGTPGSGNKFVTDADARNTDSRTPTAHASTHNSGGSDALAADAAAATPSLRSLGTTSTKAAAGNDSRLSDSRTPTAHASTHNSGGSDALAADAAAATPSLRSLGTTSTKAAAGNDSRLSDSRTPTAHATSHKTGGSDPLRLVELASVDAVPASPNAADEEFNALSGWTTLGSLDVSEITSYAGHYRIKKTATGTFQVHGIYKAIPSMPFTMTAKIKYEMLGNFQSFGLMLAEAAPGKLDLFGCTFETSRQWVARSSWSSRTARTGYLEIGPDRPMYWRLVVASSTDVTYQVSDDGILWTTGWANVNPGFTIGAFGIFVTGQDNSVTVEGVVAYIRFTQP